MPVPVPLEDRPRSAQFVLACVVPFIFGGVVGIALGASAAVYWLLLAIAAVGAVLAGREHRDARGAALRGLLAGALFGGGILLAHLASGAEEEVSLGDVPALLIVINAVIGAILSAVGARFWGPPQPDERMIT